MTDYVTRPISFSDYVLLNSYFYIFIFENKIKNITFSLVPCPWLVANKLMKHIIRAKNFDGLIELFPEIPNNRLHLIGPSKL